MLYYSELLNKGFKTEEECHAAEEAEEKARIEHEKEETKRKAERKARADEIAKAREDMVAAQKKYRELLNCFIKDYGSYHTSISTIADASDFLDAIFNWF